MFLTILSAILAAIALYQFISDLINNKFSLKKLILFLVLLAICFVIYFNSDKTDQSKLSSDGHSSSAVTQSSPQLSDNSSDTSFDDPVNNSDANPTPSLSTEENDEQIDLGTPFVEVTPQSQINSANLCAWDTENDRDIIGNTYLTAAKLTVSNTIDVLFGNGESNISADVHFPFGEKATGTWRFSFVAAQEMVGNGSSAKITILADGEELYPPFILTSSTTEDLTYEITLDGIRDLVLHFECTSVGKGFCAGIVLDDSVK